MEAGRSAERPQRIGGECQRCGYSEFYQALAFHHVDPAEKDLPISKVIYSGDFDRAYAEVDKCALLCFNCHQSYHAQQWDAEFVKRDGGGWTIKR